MIAPPARWTRASVILVLLGVGGASAGAPEASVCADLADCRVRCDKRNAVDCVRLGDLLGKAFQSGNFHSSPSSADGGLPREALRAYEYACSQDHLRGCSKFASLLYNSRPNDAAVVASALALFKRTCEQSDALGCANLAAFYANGTGVPRDDKRSAALFDRACSLGDAVSCVQGNLGHVSVGHLSDARDCNEESARACARLAEALAGAKVHRLAAVLYKKGCDLASGGDSCLALGHLYKGGTGVARDLTRAADFYGRACSKEQGEGCQLACQSGLGKFCSDSRTPTKP